jgi:AraC family transcriptional regulator, arabinose operon regulatory protein
VRRNGVNFLLRIATVGGKGRFAFAGREATTEAGDRVLIYTGRPRDYGIAAS